MLLIHPKAEIPIVQVSVLSSENPAEHYKMGQALGKLRDRNIAIVGSGFASFHNLRLLFSGATRMPGFKGRNDAWSQAVGDATLNQDPEERLRKLLEWRKFPGAFEMHPRGGAEHFLPLIVCAGAAGNDKGAAYSDDFNGLDMWSYYWQ
jgi:aromatic ring-opening dioxygenase catalytic subunit (LigB family)